GERLRPAGWHRPSDVAEHRGRVGPVAPHRLLRGVGIEAVDPTNQGGRVLGPLALGSVPGRAVLLEQLLADRGRTTAFWQSGAVGQDIDIPARYLFLGRRLAEAERSRASPIHWSPPHSR